MRRSAAGRAGGRPAAEGADRTRPQALLRAAVVVPLLAVPLLVAPLPVVGPAGAQAAPPVLSAAPVQHAVPGDEDTTDD